MYIDRITLREDAAFTGEDAYLQSLPAVRALREPLKLRAPVTFLVGENGSGKSTLLEAAAVSFGFNPEGGSVHFHFSTAATHSGLHRYLRLAKGVPRPRDGYFLRAESFYNVMTEIDRLDEEGGPRLVGSYGGRSLHTRSHGEGFLALLLYRFGGQGLYLLDEPEAALSASRQLTLLSRLHQLVQAGSQFLIATHSPILTAYPNAQILTLDGRGLTPTPYRETENYQITRAFLEHPQRMLDELL